MRSSSRWRGSTTRRWDTWRGRGGPPPPASGTPRAAQYDLCVNYLVLDGYDRRDVTITGTIVADNPAFRRLINQLKLTEPVSNSDT